MKKILLITVLLLQGCFFGPTKPEVSGVEYLFDGEEENALKSYSTSLCELLSYYPDIYEASSNAGCTIKIVIDSEEFKIIRNEIQSHVISVSNEKCTEYKRKLHQYKADANSMLGVLSTVFSGAGAVVTHAQTAKVFAAAGAIASGSSAEINQAYFANLTIEVITSGINQRRNEILEKIQLERNKERKEYPINGAIQDALRYHDSCTAVTGLEVAIDSINRVNNPGPKEVMRFLKDLGLKDGAVSISTTSKASTQTGTNATKTGTIAPQSDTNILHIPIIL